jgi:hypothetical protein
MPAPAAPVPAPADAVAGNPWRKVDVLEEVNEPIIRHISPAAEDYDDDYEYDYRPRRYRRDGAAQGLGIAGFVCGLLSVVFLVVPCLWLFTSIPLAIIGLVLSAVSCSRSGFGVAGLVLSLITLGITAAVFFAAADAASRIYAW